MLVMRTIENPAHPLSKLVCSEKSVWLDDLALRVNPLRLNGVQPWTLLRKQTTHDPHPKAALLDATVMLAEPSPDLLRDVPARVVPDEQQNLLSGRFELFQAPLEEPRRYGTHRPSVHEPQPRLIELWKVESLEGRVRSRIRPSARGHLWEPTAGRGEEETPPRPRRSRWEAPPGSTSTRHRSRWPTRDQPRRL